MYRVNITFFFVICMLLIATASFSTEQNTHLRFLQAKKAYIEAVNQKASAEVINRLAKELYLARENYKFSINGNSARQSQVLPLQPSENIELNGNTVNSENHCEQATIGENLPDKQKSSPWSFLTKLKDKVFFAANQLRELFPKLSRLQAFFIQRKIKEKQFAELRAIAVSRRNFGWHPDDDISGVVNAHYTNTTSELKKALESECNFFECDVRLEGPLRSLIPIIGGERRPVTAHDPFQTNGMLFEDWVKIVAESNRGIKVDLKTDNALDGVLATLKKYKIVDRKLILNINVTKPGIGPAADKDERLKKIRRDFPECYIKLSPGSGSIANGKYTDAAINRLIEYAKAAGQPVLFAMRADFVSPEIVKKLEKYGRVSIWNTTWSFNPRDVKKEVERFRSWGVTGIIDLMSTFKKNH
ncbi:MAG: hypothetical protein Kow0029_01030 [Candidatus Rifleibacteriota bacterium]